MRSYRGRNRTAAATANTSPGEWARRMRLGEAAAVDHVRARVRKILAFKRLRIPGQDRDDLEQEIMTEVWQAVNRPGFDFTAGFWGFVEVVTSRRCIDWLRSRKVSAPISEESPGWWQEPASENPRQRKGRPCGEGAGGARPRLQEADPSTASGRLFLQRDRSRSGQDRRRFESPNVPLYPCRSETSRRFPVGCGERTIRGWFSWIIVR